MWLLVAINGVITNSWNNTEWKLEACKGVAYNVAICTLWNDEARALKNEKEDIELAIRLKEEGGRTAVVGLTQLYYA